MFTFAADLKSWESVGGIVVVVLSIGASVVSYLLSRRANALKRDEEQQRKEAEQQAAALKLYCDQQVGALAASLQQLKNAVEFAAQAFQEVKQQQSVAVQEIWATVDTMEKNCTRHQSVGFGETMQLLRRDVDKVLAGLDRTDQEMHRYVSTDSYRHDLKLWTNSFNTMRQSIHDLALLVRGILEAGRDGN